MQLILCMCILLMSITVYYTLGKAFSIKCRCSRDIPETICIGFFLYFAAFQAIAEVMIFTKQKLHILGISWFIILILLLAVAFAIIYWHNRQAPVASDSFTAAMGIYPFMASDCLAGAMEMRPSAASDSHEAATEIRPSAASGSDAAATEIYPSAASDSHAAATDIRPSVVSGSLAGAADIRPSMAARLLLALMVSAIVCECASAVLMQRNIGWDFAYYIGNMATSVSTDTMYLYDGSSGLLRSHLELRYALSSFYMNTAWISQMTGISALLLQKYVMGVLCVLLTNAVVYSFAMRVFGQDQKKAAILVTAAILLTIFWDVYDTSAQFLMLRSYEAKAYCANVVLPMVLYLLYRVWEDSADIGNWAELFLVALASVAVSMSSLVLVPALTAIMLLAHLFVERRWDAAVIRRGIYCMLPNICYLAVYFAHTAGWLVVEV